MAQATYQQMAQALFAAGFKGDAITTMIAIAMGESGGDPNNICDSCLGVTEYSVGLWQINLLAHPDVTKECALDPACAAKAAYRISDNGTNFTPWTQFTNGGYQQYIADIKRVISQPINSAADLLSTISDADIMAAISKAPESLLHAIADNLPSPFDSLIGLLPLNILDIFTSHIPVSVIRKALMLSQEVVLFQFFDLIPAVAGVGKDVASAVTDKFSDVWGFAMPDKATIMHVVGTGLMLATGVGLVLISVYSFASRSETLKTAAGTAVGVGTAIATDGASTTLSGAAKTTTRRQARARAVKRRQAA